MTEDIAQEEQVPVPVPIPEPNPVVAVAHLYGRVTNIRLPNQGEGNSLIAALTVYDHWCNKGHLTFPYDSERMTIGQVFELEIILKRNGVANINIPNVSPTNDDTNSLAI